ncbi:MAG: hypothetical protein QOD56_2211 [Gammaproteobacteria bacterium]|nr:hypothetical protein [Gammaproteobacteria bacterium]
MISITGEMVVHRARTSTVPNNDRSRSGRFLQWPGSSASRAAALGLAVFLGINHALNLDHARALRPRRASRELEHRRADWPPNAVRFHSLAGCALPQALAFSLAL